jgi:hypothetical protein
MGVHQTWHRKWHINVNNISPQAARGNPDSFSFLPSAAAAATAALCSIAACAFAMNCRLQTSIHLYDIFGPNMRSLPPTLQSWRYTPPRHAYSEGRF